MTKVTRATAICICAAAVCALGAGEASGTITSLFGDKDGFGVGCPIQDGLHYGHYGFIWADNRGPGDTVTDVWTSWTMVSWAFHYDACDAAGGQLELFVAGIADTADWTMQVIYNGMTIYTSPTWTGQSDITHLLQIDVPTDLLTGSDNVVIVPSGGMSDGWIFDYAELQVECVPEPGTSLLLGTALLGLCGAARRSS